MMADEQQQAQQKQQKAGRPDPYVFESFEGVDTNTTRPGVPDKKMAWSDGFMPISAREIRTLPGTGGIFWTAPSPIVCYYFCNLNGNSVAVVFLANGAVYQVNTATGAATVMFAAGTITGPGINSVGATSYSNTYVLIVSSQKNGYFVWDGKTGYAPGASVPTIGTVPTGISGTCIETYQGRVWIGNGAVVTFSAPGSFINFDSGSGGGNFTSTDTFLRQKFVRLIQSSGFLYLIADSSINYISGVQTSGSPPVTTFTNQNSDPEVGTPYPASVLTYGRNILFANSFGAQVSYGSAVNKISEEMDGIFNSVPNFGGLTPTSAKAIIFGKKVFMCLVQIVDLVTQQPVNKLLMWNGKIWWTSGQEVALKFISTEEVNSNLYAWGTDGVSLYKLFQNPTGSFTKTLQTRLWDAPGGYHYYKYASRLWMLAQYNSVANFTIRISLDNESGSQSFTVPIAPGALTWTNNSGAAITWTNSGVALLWASAGNIISVSSPDAIYQQGVLIGATITTNASDLSLISVMIQPEIQSYRG